MNSQLSMQKTDLAKELGGRTVSLEGIVIQEPSSFSRHHSKFGMLVEIEKTKPDQRYIYENYAYVLGAGSTVEISYDDILPIFKGDKVRVIIGEPIQSLGNLSLEEASDEIMRTIYELK